jgi:2'-5' RNA ligase
MYKTIKNILDKIMKTFKDYLIETTGKGNYVCIDSEDLGAFFARIGMQEPVSGKAPPNGDYHCTLMYSTDSSVNPDKAMANITSMFPREIKAEVVHFECFDSLPEEGVRDEAKSCIVMELQNPLLNRMHEYLKSMGMQHSFPEYRPHVTLRYNMSVEEAHYYKDKLNSANISLSINLANFKSETINKDYV